MRWYDEGSRASLHSPCVISTPRARVKTVGEDHDPETHLIPIALQARRVTRESVEVYGDDYPTPDGTCVRDYIHVIDLARAHMLALGALDEGSRIYNLGCGGDGYSVNEVSGNCASGNGKRNCRPELVQDAQAIRRC